MTTTLESRWWAAGLCLAVTLLGTVRPLHAHGGDDHGAPVAATNATVPPHPTHVATTADLEVVVRHEPLTPGHAERLDFYLSDFATNAPVENARIEASLRSAAGEAWHGVTEVGSLPGSYRAMASVRAAGTYNLIVRISGPRVAAVAMPGVVVGAPAAPATAGSNGRPGWLLPLLVGVAALALGLAAGVAAGRRGRRATRVGAAGLLLMTGLATGGLLVGGTAHAHEGHDAAPAGAAAAPQIGGVSWLAKESQFAAGVRTVVARPSAHAQELSLMGRVAPSPTGSVDILAPQSGRVDAAHGGFPRVGQPVRAGQTLASLLVIDALPLRAPIAGIVTDMLVVRGQMVQAGQKLFSIVNSSEVWVHADVFPSDIPAVDGAGLARVTVPGAVDATALPARRVANPSVAGETPGTVERWFAVSNNGGRLAPGALVNVAVPTAREQSGIEVPRSALLDRNGQTIAFVHTAPEEFTMRMVTVQGGVGDPVLVTSGLAAGERVVVRGAYQILTGGTPLVAR